MDEGWEDGGPDFEEGDDGRGLVDVPVVVDGRADLGQPEGVEHGFVVRGVFRFGDEAVACVFGFGVFAGANVEDGAETAEVLEEEEGVGERRPRCELLTELRGGVSWVCIWAE